MVHVPDMGVYAPTFAYGFLSGRLRKKHPINMTISKCFTLDFDSASIQQPVHIKFQIQPRSQQIRSNMRKPYAG